MGGRCERAVQRSRWWGQRSLVRNKELSTVSVLVLKRRSHIAIGKAREEGKCSERRANIDFRDLMFQKLKQNVQFTTGAGTHGLLWSEIMPKGIDVGAINTGVQNESI